VQEVRVDGPNAEAISAFVKDDLQGSQFLLLPKSSIFILQQRQIREHILSSFPNVQAVSITPSGLTTLTIKTVERATAFWWCGTMYALPLQTCYQADTEGRIFAPVSFTEGAASSSMLWLFSPVATSTGALPAPLGSSIVNTKPIPNALSFVKAMKSLGANIVAVDIRGDEADLYTQAGTRITYVLGREEQAAALAATSFPSLKLNDGSLLYVDLRFDSKVFFKKKGKP
jgi:hypothetical protein